MDIRLAREFGYRIKLIGQVREVPCPEGKQGDDSCGEGNIRLEAGVFPALVYHKFLLARVGGVYNAVRVDANASGPLFFHGRGAGDLPTAGAVLGDLLAVARDERPNNTGFVCKELPKASIVPPEEWRSCYYVRVMLVTLLVIMVVKPLGALLMTSLFRKPARLGLPVAASLAQVGEFSFILAGLGISLGIFDQRVNNALIPAAIISITLNPMHEGSTRVSEIKETSATTRSTISGMRLWSAWRRLTPSRLITRPSARRRSCSWFLPTSTA
jgi:Homoserine dehydrogenase